MKPINKGRKYNTSTKGFKIDLHYDGVYHSSTDQYKTCKAAKDDFINKHLTLDPKRVTANFDKI